MTRPIATNWRLSSMTVCDGCISQQESIYYYITVMNENYVHPPMPTGAEDGIVQGMYLLQSVGKKKRKLKVQLLGSGAILREVEHAAQCLDADFEISADVWSVTSFNQLARDGQDVERYNRLHPGKKPKPSYVERCLGDTRGPVIAATDYIKAYAEQIRAYIPRSYHVLGTDGYGRSDTRQKLRGFFEVDYRYVVITALNALAKTKQIDSSIADQAIDRYKIDRDKINPVNA